MAKKSKLLEKGTRMPDIRETSLDETVREYLDAVQSLSSEAARAQRFTLLLQKLFRLQPGFIEDYVAGVEKYVKVRQKDAILRGKADELFGNVVIEFERDLTVAGKQAEAEGQLRKYVACLWSQEPVSQRTRYLCLATDGVLFTVYTPILDDPNKATLSPEDVRLETIDRINAAQLEPPREFYFWLDRYLLRREIMAPRSENIVKDFGLHSHAFQVTAQSLLTLWERLKGQPEFAVVYEAWEKYLRIVYGSALADDELFIRHTYLAILAKLMAWVRLIEGSTPDAAQIQGVLEGRFFKDHGIENFLGRGGRGWNGNSPPAPGTLAQLQPARTLRGRAEIALPGTGGSQDAPRPGRVLHPRLAGRSHGRQAAKRTAKSIVAGPGLWLGHVPLPGRAPKARASRRPPGNPGSHSGCRGGYGHSPPGRHRGQD